MAVIYIFRHGDVDPTFQRRFRGRIDCALSEEGLEQSKTIAAFLSESGVERVITTGLRRTDTVGRLAREHGVVHMIDPRLQEVDFGIWQGKTWKEIGRLTPIEAELFDTKPDSLIFPSGESVEAVKRRIAEAWRDLLIIGKRQVAIIGHSFTNACLLAHILGKSVSDIPRKVPYGMMHEVQTSGGKILTIRPNVPITELGNTLLVPSVVQNEPEGLTRPLAGVVDADAGSTLH